MVNESNYIGGSNTIGRMIKIYISTEYLINAFWKKPFNITFYDFGGFYDSFYCDSSYWLKYGG